MTKIGRLPCCAAGAEFVGLRHSSHLFYAEYKSAAAFLALMRKTPPQWTMHTRTFVTRWEHATEHAVLVSFCPFCGTKVPGVRLRKNPPEKICAVIDGGYYCATCRKRGDSCTCHLPERLWEAAPCTG